MNNNDDTIRFPGGSDLCVSFLNICVYNAYMNVVSIYVGAVIFQMFILSCKNVKYYCK